MLRIINRASKAWDCSDSIFS